MNVASPRPVTTPIPVSASPTPAAPADRVVVVGAGPAGMATAIELAQHGIGSVVLEKRGAVAGRENLFNVTPPFADRLAALDGDGSLTKLLVPTERMTSEDATTGKVGERWFDSPLAPDASRSRSDMDALVKAAGPPSAPGADTRRWSKVGIGDLENTLRQLARTEHGDLIELRPDTGVSSIRQGDGWVEAVLDAPAGGGAANAVRGALLVDASGGDLLGGPRTVFPEQSHWIGGRFAPPADGSTATLRRRAADDSSGAPHVTIKLPSADRTLVWAQVPEDPRAMTPEQRATLLEQRAHAMGVDGAMVDQARTAPVTVQLWTSDEPAKGRVLKVGDSVRAPYFPTSTGAAAALVHDVPRAVDAIRAIRDGAPVDAATAAYADAVRGANERLLAVSRHALLADLGLTDEQGGAPSTEVRAPAGSAASPHAG